MEVQESPISDAKNGHGAVASETGVKFDHHTIARMKERLSDQLSVGTSDLGAVLEQMQSIRPRPSFIRVRNGFIREHAGSVVEYTLPSTESHLFSRPKQRLRWDDEVSLPHVNWGDLFFDLFYVGAAFNLGNILKESTTNRGILYFVGCYCPIILFWVDKMYYDSRFEGGDDSFHRCVEVFQLCVLATAAVHIRPVDILSNTTDNIDMFAFSLACLVGSLVVILKFIEVALCVVGEPTARKVAWRDARDRLPSTVFFLAAAIVAGLDYEGKTDHRRMAEADDAVETSHDTNDIPLYLCLAGSIAQYLWASLVKIVFAGRGQDHKENFVPMNLDYVIHRYGEWTMLMLGESILSLLVVDVSESDEYYLSFYAGILSVTMMQYLHFRSQPHHPEDHAFCRSLRGSGAFFFLMTVYSAGLIAVGASYKMIVYEYTLLFPDGRRFLAAGDGNTSYDDGEDRQQRIANLFCGSMAIAWFSLDMIILSHKGILDNIQRFTNETGNRKRMKKFIFVVLRGGLICFIATLRGYVNDPEQLALIGLAGVGAQVVLRLLGDAVFPDENLHTKKNSGEEQADEENQGRRKGTDDVLVRSLGVYAAQNSMNNNSTQN